MNLNVNSNNKDIENEIGCVDYRGNIYNCAGKKYGHEYRVNFGTFSDTIISLSEKRYKKLMFRVAKE
jgi:hypothetical protein